MTPEIIAILTIGVTLGSGQLATALWITGRFERMEKSIAERFERAEQRSVERFERVEQHDVERFERAEQRGVERFERSIERIELSEQRSNARFEQAERNNERRFEQAERNSERRFEHLLQGAAEIRERVARIEGLVEGGVIRGAAGTSRDPNVPSRTRPPAEARQAT